MAWLACLGASDLASDHYLRVVASLAARKMNSTVLVGAPRDYEAVKLGGYPTPRFMIMVDIAGDPKSALASYIEQLEDVYYPWYDSATTRNYYFWFLAQAVALLAGFATAILAALLKDVSLQGWAFGRVLLIVIPIVGSLASTYLVQSRIAELEALREKGRQGIQRLAAQARADFAAAATPQQLTDIHTNLIAAVTALEEEQARGFTALIPKQVAFKKV